MSNVGRMGVVGVAAVLFAAAAFLPWHADASIRRAVGIVLGVLVLWISEIAPLGVIALLVPVAAKFSGLLKWSDALASWGDPIVFLFLGTFLLARALDKCGVFERFASFRWRGAVGGSEDAVGPMCLLILLVAGGISTMQNNTAVTALLLPVVLTMSRRTAAPALPLLALSYGATFGGMATPVGTAPNFLGFENIQRIDPQFNFLTWMKVGVPVWIGTTVIGCGLLFLARRWARAGGERFDAEGDAFAGAVNDRPESRSPTQGAARGWAVGVFLAAAATWLVSGAIISFTEATHPWHQWVRTYLPESLVPLAAALSLFLIRPPGSRNAILDRADLHALDWDTLFLIAGGLCLGKVLQSSGAADGLARTVGGASESPIVLMLVLAGATVLLSELTSNTATAALLVPLAAPLAQQAGIAPVKLIWLVALSASLGFALPISTPPNAIVYGTRRIRLRLMAGVGLLVDTLSVLWVVACVHLLA